MQCGIELRYLPQIVRDLRRALVLGGQHSGAQILEHRAYGFRAGRSVCTTLHGLAGGQRDVPATDCCDTAQQANGDE